MARRVVGVIGGMGPAATVHFMGRVLALTPAARDQDHVRLIVDNNGGVLDRNAAVRGQGPSPGPELANMARGLERAGAVCGRMRRGKQAARLERVAGGPQCMA